MKGITELEIVPSGLEIVRYGVPQDGEFYAVNDTARGFRLFQFNHNHAKAELTVVKATEGFQIFFDCRLGDYTCEAMRKPGPHISPARGYW